MASHSGLTTGLDRRQQLPGNARAPCSLLTTTTTSLPAQPHLLIERAAAQQQYPNFYAGLAATRDAQHTKRIVDALGLQKTFANPQLKLTVFVPRDAAIDAVARRLRTTPAALTGNRGLMQQVLYYHIVTGAAGGPKAPLPASKLAAGAKLNTMLSSPAGPYTLAVVAPRAGSGAKAAVKAIGSTANVVRPDMRCGAGIAHGIDGLLLPVRL